MLSELLEIMNNFYFNSSLGKRGGVGGNGGNGGKAGIGGSAGSARVFSTGGSEVLQVSGRCGANGSNGNGGAGGNGGQHGLHRESAWDTRDKFWINDEEKGWGSGYNWVTPDPTHAKNGSPGQNAHNETGQKKPADFSELIKVAKLNLRKDFEAFDKQPKEDMFSKLQNQIIKNFDNNVNWTSIELN